MHEREAETTDRAAARIASLLLAADPLIDRDETERASDDDEHEEAPARR